MTRCFTRWSLLVSACLLSTRGYSVTDLARNYHVKAFTLEDGLPNNTIHCLLQAHDGYLWIGTRNGLARFDGLKFTIYDQSATPAFVSNDCLSLAEDSAGTLWIGTANGLVRRRGAEWTYFPPPKNGYSRYVDCVIASREGGLWLGTRDGLFRFHNDHLEECTNWPPPAISHQKLPQIASSVVETTDGEVFISNGYGLFSRAVGQQTFFFFAGVDHWPAGTLLGGSDGVLWWITPFEVNVRRGNTTERLPLSLPTGFICSAAAQTPDGTFWIGTSTIGKPLSGEGLYRFQNVALEKFNAPAVAHCVISSILPDREGNIWVGTAYNGLVRLQPLRLLNYTRKDGLADDDVWSIAKDHDGGVWVSSTQGISHWRNGDMTNFSLPNVFEFRELPGDLAVFVDHGDNVWAGGMIYQFGSNGFKPLWPAGTMPAGVRSVFQDRNHLIWMACDHSLLQLCDRMISTIYITNAEHGIVQGIQEDPAGRLWFGSAGIGLHCLENGRVRDYTTRDGLSSDSITPALADPDGTVWFGSDNGITRYRNGRFTKISRADGLWDPLSLNILEDDFGWFWVNTERGIYRVKKQDLNDFADHRISKLTCTFYNEHDGMKNSEGNGGTFPNSCKTHDGRLWFPTVGGVVVIDPKTIISQSNASPVLIEDIIADGERITDPGGAWRFAPGHARILEFHYSAISLSAPQKLRFRYRLEGQDRDWVEAADRRLALYTNLRPGYYRFRVGVFDGDGNWAEARKPFAFMLAPHFYQTSVFYFLCIATILGCGVAFTSRRLHVQRKLLQLESAHALDKQRSRIARDMHDELGASLTQIQLLSSLAEKETPPAAPLQQHIRKIGDVSERVLRDVDEMVWAVNPRHDRVSNLIDYICSYAEDYLHAAGLHCRLHVPESIADIPIGSDARHSIFLTIKEALHNIVKHAEAAEVHLNIDQNSGQLEITIEDDGKGFDPALPPHPRNLQPSGGREAQLVPDRPNGDYRQLRGEGLLNMRQRITELGGVCEWQTSLGTGTRVTFHIPLPLAHQVR